MSRNLTHTHKFDRLQEEHRAEADAEELLPAWTATEVKMDGQMKHMADKMERMFVTQRKVGHARDGVGEGGGADTDSVAEMDPRSTTESKIQEKENAENMNAIEERLKGVEVREKKIVRTGGPSKTLGGWCQSTPKAHIDKESREWLMKLPENLRSD